MGGILGFNPNCLPTLPKSLPKLPKEFFAFVICGALPKSAVKFVEPLIPFSVAFAIASLLFKTDVLACSSNSAFCFANASIFAFASSSIFINFSFALIASALAFSLAFLLSSTF